MSTFSENLRKERQKKKISQESLGKMIGVTGVTIMRYEKGDREPKLEIIKQLANALKIPVSKLIDFNSPIMNKATKKFISRKYPEEDELFGDTMDEIVMNSSIGPTINDYQATIEELNSAQLELITMAYELLDTKGKKSLFDYAQQLLENSEDYKKAIKEFKDNS